MLSKKNAIQKLKQSIRQGIDGYMHPYGINLFPKVHPPVSSGNSRHEVFDQIFETNSWGSAESRSGVGSELNYTTAYRIQLIELLRRKSIKSIIDAPCGDLLWMKEVLCQYEMKYIGGDISHKLVSGLSKEFPMLDLRIFDICVDSFPDADVWHCRDCLFHLPDKDIIAALRNFARSNIPWALITSHQSIFHRNLDVAAGGFRLLDLRRSPFCFPPASEKLLDYKKGQDFPRYVGLWSRQAIAAALQQHRSKT